MSMTLRDLLEVGAYYGHKKELSHPNAQKYIYTNKDQINIIDLEKTIVSIDQAILFLKEVIKNGKKVVFVGTKMQARDYIKEIAQKLNMPYVNHRWLGGTLTNSETIKKRIKKYKDLESLTKDENAKKMTKKEQVDAKKELAKLDKFFIGLKDMSDVPGALFVIDPVEEHVAVSEAMKKKIPIVAIANTNVDFDKIDYPIPANDNAKKSIELIVKYITNNLK